jgi:hypothetical protein
MMPKMASTCDLIKSMIPVAVMVDVIGTAMRKLLNSQTIDRKPSLPLVLGQAGDEVDHP